MKREFAKNKSDSNPNRDELMRLNSSPPLAGSAGRAPKRGVNTESHSPYQRPSSSVTSGQSLGSVPQPRVASSSGIPKVPKPKEKAQIIERGYTRQLSWGRFTGASVNYDCGDAEKYGVVYLKDNTKVTPPNLCFMGLNEVLFDVAPRDRNEFTPGKVYDFVTGRERDPGPLHDQVLRRAIQPGMRGPNHKWRKATRVRVHLPRHTGGLFKCHYIYLEDAPDSIGFGLRLWILSDAFSHLMRQVNSQKYEMYVLCRLPPQDTFGKIGVFQREDITDFAVVCRGKFDKNNLPEFQGIGEVEKCADAAAGIDREFDLTDDEPVGETVVGEPVIERAIGRVPEPVIEPVPVPAPVEPRVAEEPEPTFEDDSPPHSSRFPIPVPFSISSDGLKFAFCEPGTDNTGIACFPREYSYQSEDVFFGAPAKDPKVMTEDEYNEYAFQAIENVLPRLNAEYQVHLVERLDDPVFARKVVRLRKYPQALVALVSKEFALDLN